jgi:hypothetical protein
LELYADFSQPENTVVEKNLLFIQVDESKQQESHKPQLIKALRWLMGNLALGLDDQVDNDGFAEQV